MADVAARELRNRTRDVLARVEGGEEVAITVNGRRVARLVPMAERPQWVDGRAFLRRLQGRQADPGLADDLCALVPDLTDDPAS